MRVRELHSDAQFDAVASGPDSDPLVVLIHGSLDRSAGMARLARETAAMTATVRFDRRGYNDRWDHPGPFSIEGNVDDVQAIVGHRRCVLVGHSYGGIVAVAAAVRLGPQVLGVSTYESPLSWLPWWPTNSAGQRGIAAGPEAAAEAFMVAMIGRDHWERLPDRTRNERRREGRALVGELSQLRQGSPWDPTQVACPVLCGVRADAPAHQARAAGWMRDNLPDAHVVEIDGADHGAHLSHPKEFARGLIEPHLAVREP